MKIIYGVQGEGFGHSSRSKVVIDYLLSKGHEVRVLTSGKGLIGLKDYSPTEIFGLKFSFKGEKVSVSNTMKDNLENAARESKTTLSTFINLFKEFKPDLAITDFEPLVPFVSNMLGVPFLSITHQHVLHCYSPEYPHSAQSDFLLAKAVVAGMYSNARTHFVSSFYFPPVKSRYKNRAVLVGPLLGKELLELKPSVGSHVLVYASNPSDDRILSLLNKLGVKCVAYGFSKKKFSNIVFKERSRENFLKDLASCRAVISSAGFMLSSEALFLGKPLYLIPIKNQFEQLLNGFYVEKLGYGLYDEDPSLERVEQFLGGLSYFKGNIVRDKDSFDGNKVLFSELDKFLT